MSVARKGARLGAAAFALGLSLGGPCAAGVANASESPEGAAGESSATQTDRSAASRPDRAARVARTARPAPVSVPTAEPAPVAAVAGSRIVADPANPPSTTTARSRAARTTVTLSPQRAVPQPLPDSATDGPAPIPVLTVAVDEVPTRAVPSVAPAPAPTKLIAAQTDPLPVVITRAVPAAAVAAVGTISAPTGNVAAGAITDVFTGLLAPIQSLIEGIGLLIRRTFFNQAPTVNPIQTTGQVSGPITGTLNAVDPEGDPLTFRIVTAPTRGAVTVAADGTYTYSPGDDFTGIDSFNVSVADGGFHINLLDLFRPGSTEAYVQVGRNGDQPMLTFNFIYGSGSQFWSTSARSALQNAAMSLAGYFVVTRPTVLTYEVTGESSQFSSTLASAGSDLTSGAPGFFATVVQQKIQTGEDTNGVEADGEISWNFGRNWAFGSSVGGGQFDFTSTAMHELMHTFGFLSNIDRAGSNTGRSWTTFDGFIVTSTGATPIDPGTFNWLTAFNTNLTGGSGGLYFSGPQAVLVYGGLVPLYTPNPWQSGSSVSHLDDRTFTGAADSMMTATTTTGLGFRVISPLELAILKDLGYTVTDTPVFALVFLGFLRRARRR